MTRVMKGPDWQLVPDGRGSQIGIWQDLLIDPFMGLTTLLLMQYTSLEQARPCHSHSHAGQAQARSLWVAGV